MWRGDWGFLGFGGVDKMSDIKQWFEDNKKSIPPRNVMTETLLSYDLKMVPLSQFFNDVNKIRLYSSKNIFIDCDFDFRVRVIKQEIENDEDYEKRLYSIKGAIEAAKAMRRQEYLKLKHEFGNE
jgi:hypothetical protein